ncbi:MAG TPA: ABC transporter permease [Armatimonadota bacterium]|jgi:ABC-2 type transport system permease protein
MIRVLSNAIALARITLKLYMRDRKAMALSLLFPLFFTVAFGAALGKGGREEVREIMPMLVGLSIITSSFFGQGLGVVVQRERGMLRRYRLTPLGAGGLLAGTVLAGLAMLTFTLGVQLLMLKVVYHAPLDFPVGPFLLVTVVGAISMASLGLVIAAIASTMQEAQLLMQMSFMGTLFLSGLTFPLEMYSLRVRQFAQFLPPTHLVTPLKHVMLGGFSLESDGVALCALALMAATAFTIATRLFRWDRTEPLPRRAKASALLALIPVLLFGAWRNTHTQAPRIIIPSAQSRR